jgi:2-polyprenyl-3-methyl-5-hydroxy-6-metoxy-1,4-benzoquinol methylase
LKVLICEHCWLAQTEDFAAADELFDVDYAYFSCFSSSWLKHCEAYAAMVVQRYNITAASHVVELAANDGYLLQYFLQRGVPCTGVEPTASTAQAARDKGIPIIERFFGVELATEMRDGFKQADLLIANNVLAHVPDINDFVAGCALLLKPNGVATFEFPHLLQLLQERQFDTIYHEHFSYLSLHAARSIFARAGLVVFDVEELSTHGGSLRLHIKQKEGILHEVTPRVSALLRKEALAGLTQLPTYLEFQTQAETVKNNLLRFLLQAQSEGKRVAAYGAAAKGNTLLNFAGVKRDLVEYVVDRNPAKQGKYMPGSRIPIVAEEHLKDNRPDYVLLLPWNLKAELHVQLDYVIHWGGRFVVAVPELEVFSELR